MGKVEPVIPVVVDTREQLPYKFPSGWPVHYKALGSGDYSVLGHEVFFTIERKSLQDLLGCLFTPRFKAELERLAVMPWAFILIESDWGTLSAGHYGRSQANPKAVCAFLASLQFTHGVRILFSGNRKNGEKLAALLIKKYCSYLLKQKNQKKRLHELDKFKMNQALCSSMDRAPAF